MSIIENTYKSKYLKYDGSEASHPSLNIWQAKYLKYKKKYIRLKKLLFGGLACTAEYQKLFDKLDPDTANFATNFIKELQLLNTLQTPLYCGLKFVFNFWDKLLIDDSRRRIVIDGMNIIRNSLILLSFLSELEKLPTNMKIHLRNLIKNVMLNPLTYEDSIELLKSFIPLILLALNANKDFESCVVYITFQSKKSEFSVYSEQHVKLHDTTILFLGVPCYTGDPDSKDNPCKNCHMEPKTITTNESDDIVAIFLYDFFTKKVNTNRQHILWSFDNYKWFPGKDGKLRDYCLHIEVIVHENNKVEYKFDLVRIGIHPHNAISFSFVKENSQYSLTNNNLHEGIMQYSKLVDLPEFLLQRGLF